MKAITPVIATVMLMLITVGMVGVTYTWFFNMMTTQTEKNIAIPIGGVQCYNNRISAIVTNAGANSNITDDDIVIADVNGVSVRNTLFFGGFNTNGLVGYWRFEQSNGSAATNDSSSYGNMGTLTDMNLTGNATSGPTTSGQFGNALQFDGVNDKVSFGDKTAFNFSNNDFSIAFWIKMGQNTTRISGSGPYMYPIYKGGDGKNAPGYSFFTVESSSRNLFFSLSDGNGNNYSSVWTTNAFPRDSWHHVVGVRDRTGVLGTANRMYIFLDGMQQGSPVNTGNMQWLNTSTALAISGNSANQMVNGTIDEVMIWNRSLSANEITQLNKTNAGNFTLAPNRAITLINRYPVSAKGKYTVRIGTRNGVIERTVDCL